jgi:hypothetical protein
MTTPEQDLIDAMRRDLQSARESLPTLANFARQAIRNAESKLTQLEAIYQAKQRAAEREGVVA